MQFIRRLTDWSFSAPKVWLTINTSLFFIFFLVYKALVVPADNLDEYVLPNGNSQQSNVSEHNDDSVFIDPLQEIIDSTLQSILTPILQSSVEETPASTYTSIDYVIKSGDSLARIFSRLGLSRKSMYAILDADQEYLVLEPLLPKEKYTFTLDETGGLVSLTRRIDISKGVSYVRHESGGYSYEEHITPVNYSQQVVHSQIEGSFYESAKKIGLSDSNILIIHDVLEGRVDFRKDLRANDAFVLVLKTGSIDGIQVGTTQLEALQLTVKGETYRAFLHSDGRFYDEEGNSLTPSLRRWPTAQKYRISSPFNPNRLHPITGHIAPHNGVDLATPIGTKVLATGDGVVTRVATHKYAGKYLVLDYNGPYGARFLHLSKVLVKKGQKVKRGQVIALSGNTGRSTGAHLHYELHVKGHPVNPMTTKIPTTQSISPEAKAKDEQHVASWVKMMARES
ncbi:peptidoglycan DD-metalloendopeptidase family protein [Marinomonas sp. 5E14-1]|uniref:peptidoglycan DD-metalloendopeptidase family protein n=1 Tax=Marinomonas sp. 5E14-1 TaxID=3153922 RepID=UPI0032650712